MKKMLILTLGALFALQGLSMAKGKEEKARSMTRDEQVKVAQSAAPARISKDATVMVYEGGKLVEAKSGTNGFTCIPDIEDQEAPDPICMDPAAWQWLSDAASGKPAPTNTSPGIAYMGNGGWHWEKDGKVTPTTKSEAGAKRVKEPPHWMIMAPFDSKTSGLPSMPGEGFGTWVMYDGTPYSHLMIYQDPMELK